MMNLLDTYISEIGRRLPRRNHKDIEAEIRSTIEDILEERAGKSGQPVDEELTLAVLKEYGSPEHVAASYLPERYLIGPRMFPLFWLVLRIVLAVIGVMALIFLGIKLATPGWTFITATNLILKELATFAASAISVLGNIVLVFAILQHFLPEFKIDFKDEPDQWDPRSLKDITPSNQVKITETVIEVIGAAAAIVLFNFYPQLFSYTPSLNGLLGNGTVVILPILSDAFFSYVPYLTVLWGLTILIDVVLLRQGIWTTLTRWGLIVLKVASVALAIAMLTGPSLVAVTQASLTASIGDAEAASILFSLLTQVIRVALALAITFGIVDIVKSGVKLVRSTLKPAVSR